MTGMAESPQGEVTREPVHYEIARPRVPQLGFTAELSRGGVDLVLDGEEQIGRALHLVDDEEGAVADEEGGTCLCGRADRCLVEKAQLRAGKSAMTSRARVLLPVCRLR